MKPKSLFERDPFQTPLADRMRPRDLDEFVGQEGVVGEGSFLREMIASDKPASIILFGPPGSGKTTLANIVARATQHEFVAFSAVSAGVKDVRETVRRAKEIRSLGGKSTVVFLDEVHRFNKAQQDAFLPHVEDGTIVLIGATTENPSFEVNSALLSRSKVFTLRRLDDGELRGIVRRALEDAERGLGAAKVRLTAEGETALVQACDGDARRALNLLEMAAGVVSSLPEEKRILDVEVLKKVASDRSLLYDKTGEEHYNIISALHKSLRGSDAQAGLYWLARMLEGGEDPLYVARRLVRFASEDVGLADPQALEVALSAFKTVQLLGMPECDTALAEAVVYLAGAPKSNALYKAMGRAKGDAREKGSLPVPLHIRNPVTRWMKDEGYGEGYEYPHENEDRSTGQEFLPPELKGVVYYEPGPFGFEKEMRRRLEYWNRLRSKARGKEKEKEK